MDIYLLGNWAFADIGKGYLLCIGTKDDIRGASDSKISEMIQEALAVAKYRSLTGKEVNH